jgi:hypothetical protein
MPPEFYFQQDNVKLHKTKHVLSYLQSARIPVLPFPAQSPDLNPIEHMWKFAKDRLPAKKSRNLNELWQNVQTCWNEIDANIIGNLISSMPNRCRAVIKAKGGPTRY